MAEERPRRCAASLAWVPMALAVVLVASCRGTMSYSSRDYRADEMAVPRARLFGGIGYRGYDSSWEPFDEQFAFLLTGQHQWPDAPVGIECGLGFASDDGKVNGRRLSSTSADLSIGPTKTLPLDQVGRLFLNLGAGLQLSFVSEERPSFPYDWENDEWLAGYAHAALFWRVGWDWDIGIDFRWVSGEDVELPGGTREGRYFQILFGSGFAW